jgi:rhombotail lipoprotein
VSCSSTGATRAAVLVICLVAATFTAACGGAPSSKPRMASAPMAAAEPMRPPPPLDRSLFARDPNGQLSEDALQKILAAPIELDLPARVGVMPVMTPADWRGPGPDHRVPSGMSTLVERLRRDASFSLVTQTMVIPSGALGMEALREIAARYRLRYLILYREVLAKQRSLNPWAWGYATLVGALFLPGQRQEVYGYIEASMFDVKTGLLMFTTRRAITAEQRTNQWHKQEKLDKLAAVAASKFAPELAVDVLTDLRRFAAAAQAENEHRAGTPDKLVKLPAMDPPGPAVATDSKP